MRMQHVFLLLVALSAATAGAQRLEPLIPGAKPVRSCASLAQAAIMSGTSYRRAKTLRFSSTVRLRGSST